MKKEKTNILSAVKARQKVSELIFKVLIKELCVREAIKSFPPDVTDLSVQCAWHALIHYDTDQEYRINREYAQEQDDYLEMIAFILKEGKELPQNIIESYNKYYEMAMIPNSRTISGWFKRLLRFTI